ncbi:hypothetical protein B0O80DRAFT_528838 [Mortierella sp. GBAus27b]|nr:hypothetical protein B0O80DRAFT_528838 [Mortierella sp. GBAus27b]
MATLGRQGPGLPKGSSDTLTTTMAGTNAASASTHRSVNVQKIATLSAQVRGRNNANNASRLALTQLWSQCSSQDPYISSVASGSIVDLVLGDALEWSDALIGIENALSTAEGQAVVNMIHSLTNLIIAAAADVSGTTKSKITANKNVFAVKNGRHPYIALITTKASVDGIIFSQLDKIMDHRSDPKYRIAGFNLLSPFLDFCILDRDRRGTIVSSTAILWISKTLNECLLDSDLEAFVVHLFNYLCSLPDRYPMDRSRLSTALQSTISTLVDFYCLPSTQSSLSAEYKEVLGGRLLMVLLSWTGDMRRYELPTLPLLQSAQKLLRSRKGYVTPTLPFDVLWPLLSFLLMNSPTVDEQHILINWMLTVMQQTDEPLDPMIANLALLPVFQLLGETHAEAITTKCSEILRKLETLPRSTTSQERPPTSLLEVSGVAAMIQAEIAHLRHSWNSSEDNKDDILFTLGDNSTLSSLIFTTSMFHADESRRIAAASRQAQVEGGQLVSLVLFIYMLRVDPSPVVKLHLLQEAIPSLVTPKDEVTTAKVLRTILTLINGVPNAPSGAKFMSSHMGAVGVRILFLIWKRQPRIWKTLRHVIHGWVESRPRLIKTPQKGDPEYEMEVAVLATIRDICAFDAAGYAEVLIPFLANLLGSVELYSSSICTIVETMNLTVQANVVEPRAAWNVLLCHVAEHAMKAGHSGILQEMCVFYGIVGSGSEDTQVYLDLREAILVNYIQPLLSTEDPDVLAAALKALSCFTAPEILPILETESPSLYVRERILDAQDSLVVDEYSLVLDKLVRHELQHMRRGLFKDAAFKRAAADASSGPLELDRLQGVLSVVSGSILQKWQSGDVNPGLRLGYALSSTLCTSIVEDTPASDSTATTTSEGAEETIGPEVIRSRQSYRNVMAALTDVALTDHLVERISALEGWTALVDNMWVSSDDAQTLVIAETLIGDLYKKVTDGYVPAHCANALFAITGIILSLHRHSHPASTVQSSVLAKHLLQKYVNAESLTDIGGSDEVQFAVLVSLSFVTPLAAVDEKLVTSVLGVFSDRLQEDSANPNPSTDISKWAPFAAGWAFCNLLSGLVDSPTKTAELNEICHQMLQQLLAILELNTASFALTLGVLIAFPRLSVAVASSSSTQGSKSPLTSEEIIAVERIKVMARTDLDTFLDSQQQAYTAQALARLLGAPWVVAFSERAGASPEERKDDTGLLDRVLLAATSRRDLQPQLVHFTIPFCHMIHTNLDARNPSSSEISLFTARIHSLVNLIRITPTSAARHTAVVALASLFGVDWSRGPTVTSSGSHGLFSYLSSPVNPAAMASVSNSALTTLIELSGLSVSITTSTSGDSAGSTSHAVVVPASKTPSAKAALMIQDLKAGRLAAMVLGHIACHIHRLGQADTGKVIGTSTEPKDYSRLPVSSSWLRALWDDLWIPLQMGTAERAQKSYVAALELLLYTVHSLPTPLPAVNWFPLLTQLVAFEPKLIAPAIHLASRHANTSTSLMEFLIMTLSNFKIDNLADNGTKTNPDDDSGPSAEELFVGEEGLGRILTLGGLPLLAVGGDQAVAELDKVRGLEGLAKRVTLPGSRVVDQVERLFKTLFFNRDGSCKTEHNPSLEVLQLIFLDTLSNHMRSYRQGRASPAVGRAGKTDKTKGLPDDAKELLNELRSVILRVFYQVSFSGFMTAQRVLRRLADLSLTSLSHLEAAQLDESDRQNSAGAGGRVLKEAIGITSLYQAGFLTSQQEGRLTRVAESALLIAGGIDTFDAEDRKMAESAISILLHGMNAGVGERPSSPLTITQSKKKSALRLTWLQRILDLLVLTSSQPEVFTRGIVLLLGGAVLLWWDEKDIETRGYYGPSSQDRSSLKANPGDDDMEANLLAMVDDHALEHGDPLTESRTTSPDYNIQEDEEFEQWHDRFLQSIASAETEDVVVAEAIDQETVKERSQAVLGRVSLALPDIVMSIRGTGASSSDHQTANRLLRLALDSHVQLPQKQFLVTLLRRMEDLVPSGQSWLLI